MYTNTTSLDNVYSLQLHATLYCRIQMFLVCKNRQNGGYFRSKVAGNAGTLTNQEDESENEGQQQAAKAAIGK